MLHAPISSHTSPGGLDMPGLLAILADCTPRPRYAFMVLNLIAEVADGSGHAGPEVVRNGAVLTIREWLCDALMPMAREPRRLALAARVKAELEADGLLPADQRAAGRAVDEEVRSRLRASGKTNVSRAVSDLVRAGLLSRHYQGYRVDHHNRGAQRQAVYTLAPHARRLLGHDRPSQKPVPKSRQASLPF
jgi:hypothetical protein